MTPGPVLAVADATDPSALVAALARVDEARRAMAGRSRLWGMLRSRSVTPHSRTDILPVARRRSIVLEAMVTGADSAVGMASVTIDVPCAHGRLRVQHRASMPREPRSPPIPPPLMPEGTLPAVLAMLDHAEEGLRRALDPMPDAIAGIPALLAEPRIGCSLRSVVAPTPWYPGRSIADCGTEGAVPSGTPRAVSVSIFDHSAFDVLEIRTEPLRVDAATDDDPLARMRSLAALHRTRNPS